MKHILFIVTLCCHLKLLFSQPLVSEKFITDRLNEAPISTKLLNLDYEGTPFLTDTFVMGTVLFEKEGKTILPMRFNIFDEILEVKHRGRFMEILPSDLISRIEIGDHTLAVVQYELDNKQLKGFLFLLDTGAVNLYMKKNLSFEEWRPARAQEVAPKPARFKEGVDAFFIQSGKKIIQIKSNKDLSELFPKSRSKISDYIKKHKTKLKQDKLTELIKYYNTLQAESKT